ncbi:MAG: glycoside hydrolase, partial [Chloroflexaceae bacterium]|nr:glycoside hydrolase [Chloroflexaceae bacterium]
MTLIALVGAPATPGQAGAIPTGPNVQVTDSGLAPLADARQPDLAIQGNSLYAAWLDDRDVSGTTSNSVFFARSDDGGQNWSANKRASVLSLDRFIDRPVISVAPDGSIWIAWWLGLCRSVRAGECDNQDLQNDALLSFSVDGGQNFRVFSVFDGNNRGNYINSFPEIHAWNDRTLLLVSDPQGVGSDIKLQVLRRQGDGLAATLV